MKIVMTVHSTVTRDDVDLSIFEKYGEVVKYPLTSSDQTLERICDADIVLCNKTVLNKEILSGCKNLKYIGVFATGYNTVDVACARERGITVCNAGSYSTNAVVQQVFALVLQLCCSTSQYTAFTSEGGWQKSPTFSPFVFNQTEIAGKTLGIVGYGSIGTAVARVANAFGMNVSVYTRTPKNDSTVHFTDFDTLLKSSDIITVHCPLTEKTNKMFCAESFSKCKDGALFINTSRGGVVDEYALAEAVKSGKIGGAGLDVLTTEPMSADCPLMGVNGVIITPHVAWAPLETRLRLVGITEENLRCWIAGKPVNVVS